MEKYGYKQKKSDDPGIKIASEKGKCPECGSDLKGRPPTCPVHGSEPFEERDDKERG